MIYIIIILAILLMVVILYKIDSYNSNINRLRKDFDNITNRSLLTDSAFAILKTDMDKNMNNLRKLSSEKNNKNKIGTVVDSILEDLDSMDAILNDSKTENVLDTRLISSIELLIEDISKNTGKKIEYNIETSKEFMCSRKLITTLKMILLNSLIDRDSKEVSVDVLEGEKNEDKYALQIIIENVNFSNDADELETIFSLLNIDSIPSTILDCNIDAKYYIIRQNLLSVAKKISFKIVNDRINMIIDLQLPKEKKTSKK